MEMRFFFLPPLDHPSIHANFAAFHFNKCCASARANRELTFWIGKQEKNNKKKIGVLLGCRWVGGNFVASQRFVHVYYFITYFYIDMVWWLYLHFFIHIMHMWDSCRGDYVILRSETFCTQLKWHTPFSIPATYVEYATIYVFNIHYSYFYLYIFIPPDIIANFN